MSKPHTPSSQELLVTTWRSFRAIIDVLQQLEGDVYDYRKRLIGKLHFLGCVLGFCTDSVRIDHECRVTWGSIETLVNARFEVTKQPIRWGDLCFPCAALAILEAYQALKYLLVNLPDWCEWVHVLQECIRQIEEDERWGEGHEFDTVEMVHRLAGTNGTLRDSTRRFPAKRLLRSLETAFRDINLSYLEASAIQEYNYAMTTLRQADDDRDGTSGKEGPVEPAMRLLGENPNLSVADLAKEVGGGRNRRRRIPAARRTKPMSLKDAARWMGYGGDKAGATRLRAAIDIQAVKCEPINRQNYVFDRHDFPRENWSAIIPTDPNSLELA